MKEKYIGWVNYWCQEIRKEDVCITFYGEKPSPGIIIGIVRPLPHRECGKYHYSLECENEPNCEAQILTKVLESTPDLEKKHKPISTTLEIKTRKEFSNIIPSTISH